MTTMDIAKEMAALCREGKNQEAIDRYYSPNIESIETCAMPGMDQIQRGIQAIKGKNQWWVENHEVHGGTVEGPYPNGDRFILHFKYDVTPKQTGKRMTLDETGLYTVQDGKITKEEFSTPCNGHHQPNPNKRRKPWQTNSTNSLDVWMCNRRAAADSRYVRRRKRN
ncbi:MAG: SnoaL-like domain-containing protein [Nitrospira sp.]